MVGTKRKSATTNITPNLTTTSLRMHIFFLVDLVNDGINKREVQESSVEDFATEKGISLSNCFETSAKDGTNVNALFEAVARVYDGNSSDSSDEEDLIDLSKKKNDTPQQSGGCC